MDKKKKVSDNIGVNGGKKGTDVFLSKISMFSYSPLIVIKRLYSNIGEIEGYLDRNSVLTLI